MMTQLLFTRKYTLKMCHSKLTKSCVNEKGIGLITAIFVIVIVAMFGSLIARYLTISSVSSAEEYHWAQALYSAQSAAQVAIVFQDGGGSGGRNISNIGGFRVSIISLPNGVRGTARKQSNQSEIHRAVEVHFSL